MSLRSLTSDFVWFLRVIVCKPIILFSLLKDISGGICESRFARRANTPSLVKRVPLRSAFVELFAADSDFYLVQYGFVTLRLEMDSPPDVHNPVFSNVLFGARQ